MPTISHPTSAGVPFWKRFYRAIAAYEDAMDFDPTEHVVAALQKRTSIMEERMVKLAAICHYVSHS
ncbi:hypothetical protein C1J03_10435 [Sulfitobacter sp. SK012]|uniref:hypothetical protein n=1 Tax=Sulfitobacter sp. SK012 TaxID=1389005 RepID=UPI000E0A1F25|nr:hypothetical protein [Sulfitobacter sp. SK012]AXI46406.1 hypothetical protein C1J03_10435 [Sulfitobacter sp. SK012]